MLLVQTTLYFFFARENAGTIFEIKKATEKRLNLLSVIFRNFYFEGFDDEVLKAHNVYRKRHSAPTMTLNTSMSKSAAEWAKYLSENQKFEHSPEMKRDNNGENIAEWCDSKEENGGHVSLRWYVAIVLKPFLCLMFNIKL